MCNILNLKQMISWQTDKNTVIYKMFIYVEYIK